MSQSPLLQRILDAVDPQSTVPLKAQLRGFFTYSIGSGALQAQESLPSVRALAKVLNLSPVTVSQLYADLAQDGLIEARIGAGTFVAELGAQHPPGSGGFLERVQDLVIFGKGIGLSQAQMRQALDTALAARAAQGLVLVVGQFEAATIGYAAEIQTILPEGYRALPMMLEDLSSETRADLLISPHNFLSSAQMKAPHCLHLGMTMLPSEATRVALARIAPNTPLLAVSYFPEFLPSFKESLRGYGPHLGRIEGVALADPRYGQKRAQHEGAVVYSTGAEAVAEHTAPSQSVFEFRHSPDLNRLKLAFKAAFPHLIPPEEGLTHENL